MPRVLQTILFAIAAGIAGWAAGGWVLSQGFGGWVAYLLAIFAGPCVIGLVVRHGAVFCALTFNLTLFVSTAIHSYQSQGSISETELRQLAPGIVLLFLLTCMGATLAYVSSQTLYAAKKNRDRS
jgi:hypothetical protein